MTTKEKTRGQEFIERIEGLDAGRLAMLRRGCGERDPVEGRCPWLISFIHGVASEATAFLVASLLAQYKTTEIKSGGHRITGNFGTTWKLAIGKNPSKSIERRFHTLLNADYNPRTGEGDLPYRLRQMVRYAASKGVGIEWPVLLQDLRLWSQPDKPVQKRWASSFFSTEQPEDDITNSNEKE